MLNLIYFDVYGLIEVESMNGNKYFAIFVYDAL